MISNPPPLRPGYSRRTLDENLSILARNGHPPIPARDIATRHARRAYFAKHPGGALPLYLATQGKRLREHYDGAGNVIQLFPVRDYAAIPESNAELYAERPSRRKGQNAQLPLIPRPVQGTRY